MEMHNPPHPGEFIKEYMKGLCEEGVHASNKAVALYTQLSECNLSRALNGKARITANLALRFETVLGMDAGLLLRMQAAYDLWHERQKDKPKLQSLR